METIKFFCLILASSLLLAQTTLTQSPKEEKVTSKIDATTEHLTTNEEVTKEAKETPKIEATPEPSTHLANETTVVTKPSSEETTHTSEPTKPSSEPTKPSSEPTKPSSEPTKPTSEPTKPSTEPSKTSPEPTTAHPTEPPTTPAPPAFTWEVKRKDANETVCLKVQVQLSFKSNESGEPFELPTNASVDPQHSQCGEGNSSDVMVLTYLDKSVTLTFDKKEEDKDKATYYLSLLTFRNNSVESELNGTGHDYMIGHLKKSYLCNDDETHSMTNGEAVTWKNVQIQAFMEPSDEGKFGSAEECTQDQTSDVVPIAVGCALAGLVVIVLIAYLVGRRRSRQKGYQSV